MMHFLLLALTVFTTTQVISSQALADKQTGKLPFKLVHRLTLSPDQYKWLTVEQRKAYISELRAHFQNFEDARRGQTPVASFSFWMSQAFADGEGRCLIGGADQPLIGGKCSSRNNECEGQPDSFKCGAVFSSVCISRTPVNSISSRCRMEADKTVTMTPDQYESYDIDSQIIYNKYCPEEKAASVPCAQLKKQMESSRGKFSKTADSNQQAAQPPPVATTGADGKPTAQTPAPASTKQGAKPPVPSAAAPATTTPTTSPGSCVDADPLGVGCVNDSVAVAKYGNYEKCKEKGDAVKCGEFQMVTCQHNLYSSGISTGNLAIFFEANPKILAEVSKGMEIPPDAVLNMYKKNPAYMAEDVIGDSKEDLIHIAETVNKKNNLCGDISNLAGQRASRARCELQQQKLGSPSVTLKEITEMANKNQNEIPNHVRNCEQGKESFPQTLRLAAKCPDSEKCMGPTMVAYPLSVKTSGNTTTVEFLDADGSTKNLDIESDSKGNMTVEDRNHKKYSVTNLQKVAPCLGARSNKNPAQYAKQPECYPLAQFQKNQSQTQPVPDAAKAAKPGTK